MMSQIGSGNQSEFISHRNGLVKLEDHGFLTGKWSVEFCGSCMLVEVGVTCRLHTASGPPFTVAFGVGVEADFGIES